MTKIDPAQIAAAQAALDEYGSQVEYSRFAHHVDVEHFVERLTRESVYHGWHSDGYKTGADRDRKEAM